MGWIVSEKKPELNHRSGFMLMDNLCDSDLRASGLYETTMFRLSMPPLPVETSEVLFDVSRLLRSRNRLFGTGVDRIDLAIGLNLVRQFGRACHFLHAGPTGVTRIPYDVGKMVLEHLDMVWNGAEPAKPSRVVATRLAIEPHLRALAGGFRRPVAGPHTTYVVASHSGLGKVRNGMRRLDPDRTMRRLIYLHDIIPLEMPEYQRPQTRGEFQTYLRALTDAPVTIASNSQDTDSRVRRLAAREKWQVENFTVLKPVLEAVPIAARMPRREVLEYLSDPRPFFVIIGTIEPRKNHLLLLNIWRQMAQEGEAPRLCIVGKRGWENENVLDMLDRCEAIRDSVVEFGSLGDHEVQTLMRASKALLYPSFTEGLGIPMLEAAALGVPCIASDIPVFREIGPPGTRFLDPLDGPAWTRAICSAVGHTLRERLEA